MWKIVFTSRVVIFVSPDILLYHTTEYGWLQRVLLLAISCLHQIKVGLTDVSYLTLVYSKLC